MVNGFLAFDRNYFYNYLNNSNINFISDTAIHKRFCKYIKKNGKYAGQYCSRPIGSYRKNKDKLFDYCGACRRDIMKRKIIIESEKTYCKYYNCKNVIKCKKNTFCKKHKNTNQILIEYYNGKKYKLFSKIIIKNEFPNYMDMQMVKYFDIKDYFIRKFKKSTFTNVNIIKNKNKSIFNSKITSGNKEKIIKDENRHNKLEYYLGIIQYTLKTEKNIYLIKTYILNLLSIISNIMNININYSYLSKFKTTIEDYIIENKYEKFLEQGKQYKGLRGKRKLSKGPCMLDCPYERKRTTGKYCKYCIKTYNLDDYNYDYINNYLKLNMYKNLVINDKYDRNGYAKKELICYNNKILRSNNEINSELYKKMDEENGYAKKGIKIYFCQNTTKIIKGNSTLITDGSPTKCTDCKQNIKCLLYNIHGYDFYCEQCVSIVVKEYIKFIKNIKN